MARKTILRKLPEQHLMMLLSLLVGVLSGLAAVFLLRVIGLLHRCFEPVAQSSSDFPSAWFFVLPGLGMLISLLFVRYLIKDDIGHGVTMVLHSISRNESRIKPHNMFSSIATSAVTIGFGGSVGAEAPIVYTGAAIGSNIGRCFGLSFRNITILLGCGAAGAVSGIFKAPLAGVLFTLEILLFNISMSSMMPLLLSTVSACVVSCLLQGSSPEFACNIAPFDFANIPFYIILGVVSGFGSLYFLRTTLFLEDKLSKFRNVWLKWGVCALGLGLMLVVMPPLFGEGYDTVLSLLDGRDSEAMGNSPLRSLLSGKWGIPLFFALVFFLKVFAMTLTNAGGGVGGTFGPTLVVGAIAGFVLSRIINNLGLPHPLPEQNFVLVGMAALMAGVMQAPMTAIFLIAEITGGYALLIPLIIASTVSYGVTRVWERYSIYTKRLAQSGDLLTHDNDQSALALLNTADLIRDKYPRVRLDMTLRQVLEEVASSTAQVLAVVDSDNRFQGLVDVGSIRPLMFKESEYDTLKVFNLMEQPPAFIYLDDSPETVMRKFDKTGAWRLPVVTRDYTYLGFISNSRLLMAYRKELRQLTHD